MIVARSKPFLGGDRQQSRKGTGRCWFLATVPVCRVIETLHGKLWCVSFLQAGHKCRKLLQTNQNNIVRECEFLSAPPFELLCPLDRTSPCTSPIPSVGVRSVAPKKTFVFIEVGTCAFASNICQVSLS